jgi:hypothetical protein
MRTVRLVIAALLAMSLAILPVWAGMAAMHAAKTEMSMSASGVSCPCCDTANKCASDICMVKCFNAAALLVEGQPFEESLLKLFVGTGLTAMSPFAPQPDPPPPRS